MRSIEVIGALVVAACLGVGFVAVLHRFIVEPKRNGEEKDG